MAEETQEPITYLHRHEIMDRSYILLSTLDSLIVEHHAAQTLKAEIQAAHDAVYALYQKAGELAFAHEAERFTRKLVKKSKQ